MAIDMTDAELDHELDYSDIEAKFAPQLTFPLASALLVDGAPVVGEDRKGRLEGVLKKMFETRGFAVAEIDIPLSPETQQSTGILFVVLKDPSAAPAAAAALDRHALDKRHTLGVHTFDDVERLKNELQDEWQEPEVEQFTERAHLRGWLSDDAGRDQLAVLRGDDLSINWFNRSGTLSLTSERNARKKWTETYSQWSPRGTYLATLHGPGVALWGGPEFDRINRFAHPEASLIDFSPCEKYLITWSRKAIEIPPNALNNKNFPYTLDDEGNHICVWDILTGQLQRSFPMPVPPPSTATTPAEEEERKRVAFSWPMFKWSGDERFFARVVPGVSIQCYETPSFRLLDNKSIKIEGIVDFDWAPLGDKEREQDAARENAIDQGQKPPAQRENVLAYWVPEVSNQPARVTLLSLPSRQPVRSKNLVNVSDCKLHWQSAGDFLCVKVDRHTKTKKTLFCNLEIFRMRDKGCPIETVEMKDTVVAFAWEPKGNRFAFASSSDPAVGAMAPGGTLKTNLCFYQLDTRKGDFRHLKTVEGKSTNALFWSPRGRHLIAATLGSTSKFDVDFWDCDIEGKMEVGGAQGQTDLAQGIQLLSTTEHYGMTAIEWDPSGRYIILAGTTWQSSMEPGYSIVNFAGAEVLKSPMDKLKQVLWRPRPPTLLTKQDQKKVRKNLREYARQFEEADAAEESNVNEELLNHRQRLVDEWNAWRKNSRAALEEERIEAGRPVPAKMVRPDEETEMVEEFVEEVIEESEEVV